MNIKRVTYCEYDTMGYGVRCGIEITSAKKHGYTLDSIVIEDIVSNIRKRKYLNGITIYGDDAFYNRNIGSMLYLIKSLKKEFPTFDILIYTKFNFNKLKSNPYKLKLLKKCDFVIDLTNHHLMHKALLNKKSGWCSSKSQRIIDAKNSIKYKRLEEWIL